MSFAISSENRKKLSRLFAGTILIVAVAGLFAGALGTYWPPLDIVAHFRSHLLGVAGISGLALFLPRLAGPILIAGFLAIPLVHAGMSNIVYSAADGKKGRSSQYLKVVSLNMWGRFSASRRIKEFLKAQDADIVVLSELTRNKRALLRQLKTIYPYQISCTAGCRMAILSKRRWRKAGTQRRTTEQPRLVWARYGKGAASFTVVGVHLRTPTRSPQKQRREIDRLQEMLNRLPGSLIIAGDFNSTPWSHNFRKLMKTTGLSRAPGVYPTWPASYMLPPQLAIDHILVSKDISIERMHTGKRVSSDHLPVVAELRLKSD